ncbi:uncharacterized protein LOC115087741 [Rhinatrema bivittatum]|uniref:uncharacterized protein LOC115087741 n=1 Tax=Rhinatrema bivittatum TaxID=194408 RepID=UPI00112BD595|nr:uncharacterized protein LOC115087741 [Rhinatrema bivittatum]
MRNSIPEISFSSGSPECPSQQPLTHIATGPFEDNIQILANIPELVTVISQSNMERATGQQGALGEPGSHELSVTSQIVSFGSELFGPQKVTLTDVWTVLINMEKSLSFSISQFGKFSSEIKNTLEDHGTRLNNLEVTSRSSSTSFIKDSLMSQKQLENLENEIQIRNLHFLNFPASRLSATELFKKYIGKVLSISLVKEMAISKIYYIPRFKASLVGREKEMNILQGDSPNLTSFLEASIDDFPTRATLLVSFCSEQDKNVVFQKYLKNKEVSFCGQKIQIFPDISRNTPSRRKQFLLLKPRVLSLGAVFFLKFPRVWLSIRRISLYFKFLPI